MTLEVAGTTFKFNQRKDSQFSRVFTFYIKPQIWSFDFVVLQRTVKKCAKV